MDVLGFVPMGAESDGGWVLQYEDTFGQPAEIVAKLSKWGQDALLGTHAVGTNEAQKRLNIALPELAMASATQIGSKVIEIPDYVVSKYLSDKRF